MHDHAYASAASRHCHRPRRLLLLRCAEGRPRRAIVAGRKPCLHARHADASSLLNCAGAFHWLRVGCGAACCERLAWLCRQLLRIPRVCNVHTRSCAAYRHRRPARHAHEATMAGKVGEHEARGVGQGACRAERSRHLSRESDQPHCGCSEIVRCAALAQNNS